MSAAGVGFELRQVDEVVVRGRVSPTELSMLAG
jgi:hypothetical protein